jgi:uncharacterized membrane protein
MFSVLRKLFAGFGLDLLAAAALTGIGFVFHTIVNQGSTLALFDVLLLGIAVVAILTAYNCFFNASSGKSEIDRSRSLISMRRMSVADRSTGRNLPTSTTNDNAGMSRFPGTESVA